MPPDAIPFDELSRALVIKLRHHGDVLLTAPVFSTLKHAAPECEIDALIYRETTPMLEDHPAVAQIHTIDRGWKKLGLLGQAAAEWQLLSTLRARRYDLVIHLTEHPRGAWLAKLCGARWAVAPKQPGRLWRSAFTHQCPAPKGAPHRHTVERNLDALRRLGIPIHADGKQLTMVPGNQAERHVESLLVQHGLRFQGFVHVHPASRWLFKTWPAEHVAGLIDGLAARNLPVVLTAAPDHAEMALVEAIAGAAHVDVINLGGQLDLKDLAALSASARLFVGVDSAPMHIAAAVGTPVVAIFGPSGELEWRPWGVPHRVVASEFHPCRPCGLDGCGGGKISDCLTSLPAGKVLAACDELL